MEGKYGTHNLEKYATTPLLLPYALAESPLLW